MWLRSLFPAASYQEAKAPETTTADERFCVGDVRIGTRDLTGKLIEEIYIKVRPQYAVYRTTDRVVIQYADDETVATEQRQHMSPLNLVRAQISGLISDWAKSKFTSFKEKSAKYEGKVASALILCLEGDAVAALASLNDIKEDIIAERTSWGRFEYLISASIFSLIAIGVFTILQHKYFHFPEPSGNIWLAARAGTIGAFFSIALAIRNRTVLTSLRRRDNLADAALRILVGIVAAGVLVLILSSKILPNFKIGDAAISATDISWQTVLVVGFVAGFLERLVPDLLQQNATTHVDTEKTAADKAAADKAAADKAAADKAAADKAVGATGPSGRLYFAYGSNMLSTRLKARVPLAVRRGIGYICGHRLVFDKRSSDGSGECDAEATLVPEDRVFGVVYEIDPLQKGQLDEAECGYAEKNVEVISGEATLPAVTYYATRKDPSLRPYHWYKQYVLAGARENSLPLEYIKLIESIESIEDPDTSRAARAQAVLDSN